MINQYGCTKCQKTHYEFDNLYTSHLTHQSKHGIKTVSGEGKLNGIKEVRVSTDRSDIGITIHFEDGTELSFFEENSWDSHKRIALEHTVDN